MRTVADAELLAELRAAIAAAPATELPTIIGVLAGMKAEAFARLLATRGRQADESVDRSADRLLTPQQAAALLGVTSRWVRDHSQELHAMKLPGSRVLRFSAKRLQAMIRRRTER